jgi:hypothetical protein
MERRVWEEGWRRTRGRVVAVWTGVEAPVAARVTMAESREREEEEEGELRRVRRGSYSGRDENNDGWSATTSAAQVDPY